MPTRKTYRRGTHRAVSPSQTVAFVEARCEALGITRLADVTGLDYLGIPVFMAMRPNSRAISVSQGKGVEKTAAMASALMEAAEGAHAERDGLPVRRSSLARLLKSANVANPAHLPRMKGGVFTRAMEIEWIEGFDLLSNEATFLPFDLVHTDFTRPTPGIFIQSSNGLASGNYRLEAVIAGLCEVIERDATALFEARTPNERAIRRIRLESVRTADCRALIDLLEDRGMSVAVWDTTTDVGVACFICEIVEAVDNDRSSLGAFWGAGCHLDRSVALARATCEAAQSRLTYISGSRDDMYRQTYLRKKQRTLFSIVANVCEEAAATRRFLQVPSLATSTLEGDVEVLLRCLQATGFDQAIAVDLTDERIGIPVIRVVVPGLESRDPIGQVRLGPRVRALKAQALA